VKRTMHATSKYAPAHWPTAVALAFASFLVCPATGLVAAPVDGLYEAEVPVQGQTTEQRNEAVAKAFEKVLVKVTGHSDILSRGSLGDTLATAPGYVQEYRYRLEEAGDVQGAAAPPTQRLRVRFDPAAVDRLLRQRGLPVWSADRPAVLVWLGIETKGRRSLYVPESDPRPQTALERSAWERGLPLLLPLFDLEDQSSVELSDLWGGFDSKIRSVSQRYTPDVILVGRLRQVRQGWEGDWSMLPMDAGDQRWENNAADLETVIDGGIGWVADTLAARYAPLVTGESKEDVLLRVAGIGNLLEYGRVRAYVEGLSMVDELVLVAIDADRVSFRLRARGGVATLEQALRASGRFAPAAPEPMHAFGVHPERDREPGQRVPGALPKPGLQHPAETGSGPATPASAAQPMTDRGTGPSGVGEAVVLEYRYRP